MVRYEPESWIGLDVGESLDKVDIAELARGCTHISFDVFDTLLLRLVWKPTDVFRLVGHQLGDPGFEQNRIRAEQRARHSVRRINGYEDVTLDEIYADPALPPGAKELELEAERQLSVANPEFLDVVAAAHAAGKTLIATSDMYLPSEFVRELLEAAGYGVFEYVFISSEHRIGKGSDDLFRQILHEFNLEPDQICHIGDYRHADYEVPRSLGISSVLRPSARDCLVAEGILNPAIIQALAASSEPAASVIAGLLVWANLTYNNRFDEYWYRTGFAVAGPLAYGFTAWIAERARALDVDTIYFMARDGRLPMEIYERYFSGPPGRYLLASRRALFIPSIEELDDKTLELLIEGHERSSLRELFTRLDIGLPVGFDELLYEEFGESNPNLETEADRHRVLKMFKTERAWLFGAAEKEREAAVGYLRSIGFFDVEPRAIVDIGWKGSTQFCLERLRVDGLKNHGLYLGLMEGGYDNGISDAFAFFKGTPKNLRKIVAKSPEYFELLLSADHRSIHKYQRSGESLELVYAPSNEEEQHRLQIASEVHAGAMDFCEHFDRLGSHFDLVVSPSIALTAADRVLTHPTELDVRTIGSVSHARGIGQSGYLPIVSEVPLRTSTILKAILFRDRALLDTDSYWTQGYLNRHFSLPNVPGLGSAAVFLHWGVKRARRARVEGVRSTVAAIGRKLGRAMNAVRRRRL